MQSTDFDIYDELEYISINFKDQSQAIDVMLAFDATINMKVDVTSSKAYKEQVKKESRIIYRRIKKLNSLLGDLLINHQDK
jgi:hypothetical protein